MRWARRAAACCWTPRRRTISPFSAGSLLVLGARCRYSCSASWRPSAEADRRAGEAAAKADVTADVVPRQLKVRAPEPRRSPARSGNELDLRTTRRRSWSQPTSRAPGSTSWRRRWTSRDAQRRRSIARTLPRPGLGRARGGAAGAAWPPVDPLAAGAGAALDKLFPPRPPQHFPIARPGAARLGLRREARYTNPTNRMNGPGRTAPAKWAAITLNHQGHQDRQEGAVGHRVWSWSRGLGVLAGAWWFNANEPPPPRSPGSPPGRRPVDNKSPPRRARSRRL